MRGLWIVLVALASLPPALAVGAATTDAPYQARDDSCEPEARVVFDCWLAVNATMEASCPATGFCDVAWTGAMNASDDLVVRSLAHRVRITGGFFISETTTSCLTVVVGRGSCPAFGTADYPIAPSSCVDLGLRTTYRNGDVERARIEGSRTLCRDAGTGLTWS